MSNTGGTLTRFQSTEIVDEDTAQDYYWGKELTVYSPEASKFEARTTHKVFGKGARLE